MSFTGHEILCFQAGHKKSFKETGFGGGLALSDWFFVVLEILILFVGFCFGRLSKTSQVGIFNKPYTNATPPITKAIKEPTTLTDMKINPIKKMKTPPMIRPRQAQNPSLFPIIHSLHKIGLSMIQMCRSLTRRIFHRKRA